jgi:hypothetical protein
MGTNPPNLQIPEPVWPTSYPLMEIRIFAPGISIHLTGIWKPGIVMPHIYYYMPCFVTIKKVFHFLIPEPGL